MSLPRLHFRLVVDATGEVLVDEDVWPDGVEEAANRHAKLAKREADAGRSTTLTVTDPDGDIPTHTVKTVPGGRN